MKLDFKVEKVICQKDFVLIIFYTRGDCWQFCCINRSGEVHNSCDIFYTPWGAEIEARTYADRNLKF